MGQSFSLSPIDTLTGIDGIRGAYEAAEPTSYAIRANDAWLASRGVECDGLMATIGARDVATATANATVAVYLGKHNGVTVEAGGCDKLVESLSHKVCDMLYIAQGHIVLETKAKVFDKAIAILHDSSTHLHIAATQLDELQCIAPCLDAPNATQLQPFLSPGSRVYLRHFEDVAQGDGLDGPP